MNTSIKRDILQEDNILYSIIQFLYNIIETVSLKAIQFNFTPPNLDFTYLFELQAVNALLNSTHFIKTSEIRVLVQLQLSVAIWKSTMFENLTKGN